ncbi:uncharacterized protein si:ch211-214p13.8 [Myxocyprinus asiaticus]|uniref:uncharacterized protein si:ch211-214p13.8 n=1 Tax=Myxocyprinus asiaticus TaxID=70543 RepID=UPI0022238379|nr:uncharacterized protein si:ch211-214p13.8 [Myxocyprinus asiaticus]XP_051564517.1 uncharacterized protein si:ch211-214p13.8 [Myxocyprinus asiaticus]
MDWQYLRNTALFVALFLIFILHVSTDAQGHAPQCPVFKVQRRTVHKTCINKPLRVSCNLQYCDDPAINVTWTKADNSDEWISVTGIAQMQTSQEHLLSDLKILTSYLTFTNISKHHDGLYRCELKLPKSTTVSHYINVSVSDDNIGGGLLCRPTEMSTGRDNTDTISDPYPWWLPYLIICLGIVILVLIVMLVSILCICGFKCSRKKGTQRAQVQYTVTSMLTSPSPNAPKRGELVQHSEETHRHYSDRSTSNVIFSPDHSTLHVSDDGVDTLSNRRDNTSSHILYASLNHLTPTQRYNAPCQSGEFSEYASIRVS